MATIKCCYKCPDRHEACHSTCEKYAAEKAMLGKPDRSETVIYDYYRAQNKKIIRRLKQRKVDKRK